MDCEFQKGQFLKLFFQSIFTPSMFFHIYSIFILHHNYRKLVFFKEFLFYITFGFTKLISKEIGKLKLLSKAWQKIFFI